jgi:hypothetical protein
VFAQPTKSCWSPCHRLRLWRLLLLLLLPPPPPPPPSPPPLLLLLLLLMLEILQRAQWWHPSRGSLR